MRRLLRPLTCLRFCLGTLLLRLLLLTLLGLRFCLRALLLLGLLCTRGAFGPLLLRLLLLALPRLIVGLSTRLLLNLLGALLGLDALLFRLLLRTLAGLVVDLRALLDLLLGGLRLRALALLFRGLGTRRLRFARQGPTGSSLVCGSALICSGLRQRVRCGRGFRPGFWRGRSGVRHGHDWRMGHLSALRLRECGNRVRRHRRQALHVLRRGQGGDGAARHVGLHGRA